SSTSSCLPVCQSPYLWPSFLGFSALPYVWVPHSFPTRRSSDLSACGSAAAAPPQGETAMKPDYPQVASREQWLAARLQLLEQEKDRKSTRLNSSHVKISYAVFCLKKKTSSHHR